MGKKLITVGNYQEYVCGNKLFVTNEYIITAGAKDSLREAGIELVYGNCNCEAEVTKTKNDCCEIEKLLVEILVKEFKITDAEQIKNIIVKVKELL